VIEELAPAAAHPALRNPILPWALKTDSHRMHLYLLEPATAFSASRCQSASKVDADPQLTHTDQGARTERSREKHPYGAHPEILLHNAAGIRRRRHSATTRAPQAAMRSTRTALTSDASGQFQDTLS